MRLNVVHETHYSYSNPVVVSQQLLHLTPRELPWQQCHAHDLDVAPKPGEFSERTDFFGNRAARLLIAEPHEELRVRATTTVSVAPRGQRALALPQAPWEAVRDRLRAPGGPALVEAAGFLNESPHVETSRELADYGAQSFARGRGARDAAIDLVRRIHADFKFDKTATSVSTPLREVMKRRRGVCQDFAHLMIGALRSLALPARYVSGYLLTEPPPGRPRLVGADASHAWVAAYCGEAAGWIDLDPTNNCVVDDAHVTLGWGRDFGDVMPMHGVILGGGEHKLAVHVTVTPLEN